MSEEFCTVTRKKWMARKSVQRRPRRISDRNYEDYPDVDVDKFLLRLDTLCEEMLTSDYFLAALKTLEQSLEALKLQNTKALSCIVCFGLGPFTRNYQALHQLLFIVCLQRHCDIKEALYFDPVFRDCEKQILTRLQCKTMSENCEAKYDVTEPTLFYMPHCPNCLTNNLLWRNWQPDKLPNLIIINNSFEMLLSAKPARFLKHDSNYIMDIAEFVREYPLEDDYEMRNVFNDLSIHVFPSEQLPAASDALWIATAAPVYKDVEMISTIEFEKINLNT